MARRTTNIIGRHAEGVDPPPSGHLHNALLALSAGLLVAIVTAGYTALAGAGGVTSLEYFLPFLAAAAIVGVAPPSYVALDLARRHQWLPATAASAIALMVAFVVFWSAAIAVTPRPQEVWMDPATVVLARHYEHAEWLRNPNERDRMANDLVTSGRLRGMTPDQVTLELGTPTRTVGPGCKEMIYELARSAGMKTILLDVRFAANGRVERAAVQQ